MSDFENGKGLKKHNPELQIENLTFEIIEICENEEDLDERERYWIKYYDSFFNGFNRTMGGKKWGEEEKQLVNQVSERLGITHLLDKNIGEVSGGERQIIFIACALIQDTPIILLDEPTSALDIKNQNKVLTVLKEISKEGKTIILSSHNPNHALFLDSNIILMNKGVLATTGIAKDLITVEKLTSIYGEHVCYSNELGYREISFK